MATSQIPAGFKLVPDDNQAPEARGKAAALSAYLARKGSPKAGKRLDRAVAKFETMWSQAPDALKEKYAGRSQKTDLAPSERSAPIPRPTNASLNATRPGETNAQASERFRKSRTANDPKPPVAPPAAAPSAFAELTKPVPVPAGGVNSVGDGVFEAGKAKRIEQANALMDEARGSMSITQNSAKLAIDKTFPGNQSPTLAPIPLPKATMPSAPPVPAAPVPNIGNLRQADEARMNATPPISSPQAATPMQQAREEKERQTPSMSPADMKREDEARVSAMPARPGQPPIPSPSGMRPPITDLPTDERMHAEGKVNGGPTPVNKAPVDLNARTSSSARPTMDGNQPTGAPVMATPMSKGGQPMDPAIKSDNGAGLTRVNRLTGLPFGFRPGDALPKSADGAMQQRATDSGVRQVQAQAQAGIPAARPAAPVAGPRPMPRGPASQPERTGSSVAPIAPPRANDPDIIRKDNVAAANYQSSFSGGNPGDAEFEAAKNGQKKLYDGASSLDQAKLAVNTLKRNAEMDDTRNAPRAKVVAPARRPVMLAR